MSILKSECKENTNVKHVYFIENSQRKNGMFDRRKVKFNEAGDTIIKLTKSVRIIQVK